MYVDLFSGNRLTVWNKLWSVLSLRCDILDSTCCPLSPVYAGVCSVRGWGAGHTLVLLMLPHLLFCGGDSAQGVRRRIDYLKGVKGNIIPLFQGYGLSHRGFSSFRYLLCLGKACIWTSYQFVHPSNSVSWVLGLESKPPFPPSTPSPLWSHLCPCLPSEVWSECLCAKDHVERMLRPHILLWKCGILLWMWTVVGVQHQARESQPGNWDMCN